MIDSPLYKLFDNENFALDFVESGRVRLGSLRGYRDTEDMARADPGESMSAYATSDGGVSSTLFANPVFALCTTRSFDSALKLSKKFGGFAACISEPDRFRDDVTNRLVEMEIPLMHAPRWDHVLYNKGERMKTVLNPLELAMIQKNRTYADENEARLCFSVRSPTLEYETLKFLDVDLDGRLSYLSLLRF
jgi:hypothetical protein